MRTSATCVVWAVGFAAIASAAPAPSAALTGTVLAADGQAAAGATVWAATHTSGPLVRHEVVADAAGRFQIDLRPGTWYVWARRGTRGAR